MGNFLDLNKPLDFARATMGDAGSILQTLTQRDPKDWDIFEGSYNSVLFHIFSSAADYGGALDQVTDTGGRRKVKYQFPYMDGQTTDDLGRKAESFTMNILLFGNNYMNALAKLMTEFNKPNPGDLIHPVRGQMQVVVEDVHLIHKSDQRKAVAVAVTFIEHNFTIGQFRTFEKDKTNKNALAQALALFQKVDNAILAVRGAIIFANNIKTQVENALSDYKDNSAIVLQRMNSTFNGGSSADIPTLVPVNKGGVAAGGTFGTVTSPSDPYAAVPVSELSGAGGQAVSIQQISKEVNQLRADVSDIISLLEDSPVLSGSGRSGSLEFYDTILALKETAILMQNVLETGIASSQSKILNYTVPRTMSIREVAFVNGLTPDSSVEIELLNPSILSLNFIEKDTVLKIPVS